MNGHENDQDLKKRGLAEKYCLFYQVWRELTNDKTMKSYQCRVMNTLSSMSELIDVIQLRLDNKVKNNVSIDECKKETCSIVKKDRVLALYYPDVKNRLIYHLNEKTETSAAQKHLIYCLNLYYDQISKDYFKNLFKCLKDDIDNDDQEHIITDTDSLLSNCMTDGWSSKALYKIVGSLIGDEGDGWKRFTTEFSELDDNNISSFTVFIPLKVKLISKKTDENKKPIQKILKTLSELSFEIKDMTEVNKDYPNIKNLNSDYYLLIPIPARDLYSAAHEAINRYSDVLNLLSFFNIIEPWSVEQIQVISWNDITQENTLIKPKDLYTTYDYIESASEHFRDAVAIQNMYDSPIANRLSATYSYGNMGKASYTQEEKFITTWVALESLCRTDTYENIISNVLETVPPALSRRYIFKLVRNFYEDCKRCKVIFDGDLSSVFVKESRKQTTYNLIAVLRDDRMYQILHDKCTVNSLLAYRCEEMHTMLQSTYSMYERVEKHYKNVQLQLSRLYRKRNEIAHSASKSIYMMRYIEHLDDYLASFVSEIVMCANDRNLDSIEQIFELMKDNYQEFVDVVKVSSKKGNESPELDQFRKTGIITLI